MLLHPKFLILLCLSVFQCNGTPPKEVATKTTSAPRYTAQEDNLIIEEICRLPTENLKILSKSLWENVADKIREKCYQNAHGFRQARNYDALRTRFKYLVSTNHPELNKKLPEVLMQKFRLDINKPPRGVRPAYTAEEEKFLIEELSKPSFPKKLFSNRSLAIIRAKHDAMRQASVPGFENVRTGRSLSGRIVLMEQNGQLPQELVEKFWKPKEDSGASSSGSRPSNQRTHLEEMDEEDEDVSARNDSKLQFTNEEDEFILEELLRLAPEATRLCSKFLWQDISNNHKEKRKQKAPGFLKDRSFASLRNRFARMVNPDYPELNLKVPENLLQRYRFDLNSTPREFRPSYNPEEDDFIIKELSNPSVTNLHSSRTVQAISAHHDSMRRAKVPGFENRRRVASLLSHIYQMKKKGQLPDTIVKRIWEQETGASSSNPTSASQDSDSEMVSDEDYDEDYDEE